MTVNEKYKLYLEAKDAYYNSGTAIMTDSEFDELESWLEANMVGFDKSVGSPVKGVAEKFPHWSPMLSLDKVQFGSFKNKSAFMYAVNNKLPKLSNSEYVVLPKYDGLALNVQYKDGKLFRALTRGDKTEGRDVKHLLTWLPQNLGLAMDLEVRGEVVLPTNIFETHSYFKGQQNPRNSASGLLGRDDYIPEHDLLNFIIFDVRRYQDNKTFHYDITNSDSWDMFEQYDNIEMAHSIKFVNHINTYDYMLEYRKRTAYQLDGYVLTTYNNDIRNTDTGKNAPKHSLAIKFPAPEYITEIKDIEWNFGKTGEFTPVAILEPITFDGTTVTKASLHNWGNIIKKNLSPGAKVTIEKAGDIIPQIKNVVTPSQVDFKFPLLCPHCQSNTQVVDDLHLICDNENCSGKLNETIKSNISLLEVDYLGAATIDKLLESNEYDSVVDFLNPDKNSRDALIANGMKDGSMVTKISNQLRNIRQLKLENVIQLMGIANLGGSTANRIAFWWEYDIEDWSGMNRSIISLFTHGTYGIKLDRIISDLEKWGIEVIPPKNPNDEVDADNVVEIKNIKIEMTGSPKPNWKTKGEFLTDINHNTSNGTSIIHTKIKDADYLVTDDLTSTTGKMTTAKKLGISVITYNELFKMVSPF